MLYLELINELVIQSTLFYVYFGFVFASIAVILYLTLQANLEKTEITSYMNQLKYKICFENGKPPSIHFTFVTWFIRTYKRTNIYSGDEDDIEINLKWSLNYLGGFQWKQLNTYSLQKGLN